MVLQLPPRLTVRNVLLLIVVSTWAAVTVISSLHTGVPPQVEYWLIPAAAIAAIMRVFRDPPPPSDRGED